eukprot:m.219722 g.219722  ORF g.219722 m.219722 type:complete len:67 (+) comp13826_c0_seq11:4204-4404(+)
MLCGVIWCLFKFYKGGFKTQDDHERREEADLFLYFDENGWYIGPDVGGDGFVAYLQVLNPQSLNLS